MKFSCLILLAVLTVAAVTECKPVSDDVEKAPCVDCEQKNFRRKRSYQFFLDQAAQAVGVALGCLNCHKILDDAVRYTMTYAIPVNRSPDVYIGNGKNNENHIVINGANNVYIGNGANNTNNVSYG